MEASRCKKTSTQLDDMLRRLKINRDRGKNIVMKSNKNHIYTIDLLYIRD